MPKPGQKRLTIWIDNRPVQSIENTTVAAAMLNAGIPCRISTSGELRTALCGMGICFECRAKVDGILHVRTCQIFCRDGMRVETQS